MKMLFTSWSIQESMCTHQPITYRYCTFPRDIWSGANFLSTSCNGSYHQSRLKSTFLHNLNCGAPHTMSLPASVWSPCLCVKRVETHNRGIEPLCLIKGSHQTSLEAFWARKSEKECEKDIVCTTPHRCGSQEGVSSKPTHARTYQIQ